MRYPLALGCNERLHIVPMKKTLFLLPLAIGMTCAGVDLSELTHLDVQRSSVEFTTQSTMAYASIALSAKAIDQLAKGENINKMLFAFNEMDGVSGTSPTEEHVGIAVSTYSSSGGSGLRLTSSLAGTSIISGATTYYSVATAGTTPSLNSLFGNAQYAVLTLGISGTGADRLIITTIDSSGALTSSSFGISATNANFTYDGSVTGFSMNAASGLVTDAYVGTGAWTEAQLTDLGTSVIRLIPEPATATLSLLALAGLAARRHRH